MIAGERLNYVVAVSGPAGAGKTSLVRGLAAALGSATAIHMDSYERMTKIPISGIEQWLREGAEIDRFEMPELAADLERLVSGQSVVDPATGATITPAKHILFETQFGRAHRETGRWIDLLIWIDTPLDIALARNVRAFVREFSSATDPARIADHLRWLDRYLCNHMDIVHSLMVMQRDKVAPAADLVLGGLLDIERSVQIARGEIEGRFGRTRTTGPA